LDNSYAEGKIVDEGTREDVIKNPKSEYTKELLKAVPEIGGERLV
jgi:ABC-type dipeptide/oligopeptide/nickel transport system, ATPase component